MLFFPYAEESLRMLQESAASSWKALMDDCDATALSFAIARLEGVGQVVLTLSYYEGLDTSDIATTLKISGGEVIRLQALAVLSLCNTYAEARADQQSRTNTPS